VVFLYGSFLSPFYFVPSAVGRSLECVLVYPELNWVDWKASDVCGVGSGRQNSSAPPSHFTPKTGIFASQNLYFFDCEIDSKYARAFRAI